MVAAMAKPILVQPPPAYDPGRPAEEAAAAFTEVMRSRRSVRQFSPRPVPQKAIESIIETATLAPSGANRQPWRFVAVQDAELKRQIREGAEAEEREFYAGRAGETWLEDLSHLGTDADKGFLEVAPWLIVVFRLSVGDDGSKVYYAEESVGIATGMLLAAAHHAGLATLTHTPSPMRFLSELLKRPANERPYMLIPVGYRADDCRVPAAAMERRALETSLVIDA